MFVECTWTGLVLAPAIVSIPACGVEGVDVAGAVAVVEVGVDVAVVGAMLGLVVVAVREAPPHGAG